MSKLYLVSDEYVSYNEEWGYEDARHLVLFPEKIYADLDSAINAAHEGLACPYIFEVSKNGLKDITKDVAPDIVTKRDDESNYTEC